MTANEDTTSDDEMLELLKQTLAVLPDESRLPDETPPQAVLDGAKWIHQWLHMDADLAELTFDSEQSPELAGVRSTGSLRELTFVSGQHTIEMEIQPGQRTVEVSGNIDPVDTGLIQLVVGGEVFSADFDTQGAFILDGLPHGTVLAFAQLHGQTLRLGSFEI